MEIRRHFQAEQPELEPRCSPRLWPDNGPPQSKAFLLTQPGAQGRDGGISLSDGGGFRGSIFCFPADWASLEARLSLPLLGPGGQARSHPLESGLLWAGRQCVPAHRAIFPISLALAADRTVPIGTWAPNNRAGSCLRSEPISPSDMRPSLPLLCPARPSPSSERGYSSNGPSPGLLAELACRERLLG